MIRPPTEESLICNEKTIWCFTNQKLSKDQVRMLVYILIDSSKP